MGLPLLSGVPPPNAGGTAEMACRKCAKEFNMLFTRSRRCNHCGYAYCSSCTDYQALMPRETNSQGGNMASAPGYDPMHVCAFCIEFLQITASGKGVLRTLQLAKLRKYAAAYNIRIDHAVEKDDVINALLAVRHPNGCLAPVNEDYYRKYSVPNRSGSNRSRGLFSPRTSNNTPPAPAPAPPPQHSRPEFARPDLAPDGPPPTPVRPRTQPYSSGPPPQNPSTRPASAARPQRQQQYQQYPQHHPGYPHPGSYQTHYTPPPPPPPPIPQTSRPRASSAAPPATRAPPSPPPTLDELVEMTHDHISALSISALKAHGGNMILEKGDLVKKVADLVEDEKRERERMRVMEEREDEERIRGEEEREGKRRREEEDRMRGERMDEGESSSGPPPPPLPAVPKPSFMEHEEANIAVVDCGDHLAMCRNCCDAIMGSTRECPLCRTRIITEARLLRIYKP
ncbi:hypothetical protein BDP27DRAFT_1315567 [Rhodocollybia butyracea]|uniref:FYVE-type domain-containing protein n=1 Tax=Rhodocollybia butyracea TaxID=206335 RepID=A0A9P5UDG2_9AGAR|nr:hypothetical protein BDP27DRAFT_1315567 [Rhodocollybia butyracea]